MYESVMSGDPAFTSFVFACAAVLLFADVVVFVRMDIVFWIFVYEN